jgi:hypothetical protein
MLPVDRYFKFHTLGSKRPLLRVKKPQAKEKSPRDKKAVYFIIRTKTYRTKTAYISNIYYHVRDFGRPSRIIRELRSSWSLRRQQ